MNKTNINESYDDAILRLAVIATCKKELSEMPSEDSLKEVYTFSDAHETRMKRLFAKERRMDKVARTIYLSKRAAASAAVVIVILSTILLLDADVRAAIGKAIVNVREKFTSFDFSAKKSGGEIFERELTYAPSGFSKSETYLLGALNVTKYADAEGHTISFEYMPNEGALMSIDNENTVYEKVIDNGVEYHIMISASDEYPSHVLWTNQEYSFKLTGYIGKDELLKMAESLVIRKIKK